MPQFSLPYWIVEQIKQGQAILFLGSGASKGAKGVSGEDSLSGEELRDKLCDRFLNGKEKSKSLSRIGDFCVNESSLFEVQRYIEDLFEPLEPNEFHLKIPTFKWHSIITVNYDLVVEKSYDSCENKKQNLLKIIRDGDDFSKRISDNNAVPFLKLHGCIRTINDSNLPLILSSEQYAKYKNNRILVFKHFKEWATQHPVIFCGYDISDPNIHEVLFDLADIGVNRPAYVTINKSLGEYDKRFWSSKRIHPIKATFQDFINYIDAEIPEHQRVLSTLLRSEDLSFSKWLSSSAQPSSNLVNYLEEELEHVHKNMPFEGVQPRDFYSGMNNSWGAFEQNLDISRKVTDEIVSEAIITTEDKREVKLYLLKGYAGSGKSIVLKRAIYFSVKDLDMLIFKLREGGIIRPGLIREIYSLVNQRITILIEDAIPELDSIKELVEYCDKDKIPLTLLMGARTNEWNIYGEYIDSKLSGFWELRNLSESEISDLLDKLEEHNSLGELRDKNKEQQRQYFKLSADRQLLVALHEATYGKPFRDIVYDEYQKIIPIEAKILYLDICTLNRMGVGVRAGLISRISGIVFNYFKDKLLKPLQHVIKIYFDQRSRDYMYKCRHPLIAEFVFDQAMENQEHRVEQIIRILKYLNVDYATDDKAFSQIIRGRNVAGLFSNKSYGERIYKIAEGTGAPLAYINHQNAVFELNHPNGDIQKALAYITKAETINDGDKSLLHTKALIYRKLSLNAKTDVERIRSRNEAIKILEFLLRYKYEPYSIDTYVRILLDEIEDKINEYDFVENKINEDDKYKTRVVVDLLSKCERMLQKGLQIFPEDEYLLSREADLANLVKDKPKFIAVLEAAVRSNPHSGYIALRLSREYTRLEKYENAKVVLLNCLEGDPNNKNIHLELAKLFIAKDEIVYQIEILSHLRKSFTDGDTNYDAQFWYARQLFIYGETQKAEKYFFALRKVYLPPYYNKNKIRAIAKDNKSNLLEYQGSITNKLDNICFIHCSQLNSDIFVYYKSFKHNQWDDASIGSSVKYNLGFTLRGPAGINVECVKLVCT